MDPVLQLPPQYHILHITSTEPCPTDKSLYHKYWTLSNSCLHYITRTGPFPTVTFPILQVLVPCGPVHPIYHKYWNLSYSYLPYITSTGPNFTGTSSISQELLPVLQFPPPYHKYWSLSYRYWVLPYRYSS